MLDDVMFYLFFFFKQKTAYEMRISDWSSDVCSSDLLFLLQHHDRQRGRHFGALDAGAGHGNRVQGPGLVRADRLLSGVAGILKCHGRQCQCEQQCTAQAAQTSDANPDHVTLPSDQRSVGGLPSAWPTMPAPTSGSCIGARRRHGRNPANAGLHEIGRSEEHTSELQSLMRISYAVF